MTLSCDWWIEDDGGYRICQKDRAHGGAHSPGKWPVKEGALFEQMPAEVREQMDRQCSRPPMLERKGE